MRLFHSTTSKARKAILRDGFRDGSGSYMLAMLTLSGVFVSDRPVNTNDGAAGDAVIAIDLPDDLELDQWAIVEEGRPVWEWCVPAKVLNECGTLLAFEVEETPVVRHDGPIHLVRPGDEA